MKSSIQKTLATKLNVLLKEMGPNTELDEIQINVGIRTINRRTGDGQQVVIHGGFVVRDFNTKNESCRYYPPAMPVQQGRPGPMPSPQAPPGTPEHDIPAGPRKV